MMLMGEGHEQLIRRLSGKLLLSEELPLKPHQRIKLLEMNCLRKVPAIIKRTFTAVCHRCHNEKPSLFGTIPCAKCQKEHLYCRHCLQMGRVLACEPLYEWVGKQPSWPKHSNPCQWDGQLTHEQSIAAKRIVQAITHKERELLLWAVT